MKLPRLLVAFVVTMGVVACGSGGGDRAGDSTVRVTASTDVWAAVVRAVGGDRVEVQALIDDPAADPHSYQMTASDVALLHESDLLVYNGGGYDEQFADVADGLPQTQQVVAFDGGPNEHVWYDLPSVSRVADAVASELGELSPAARDEFTANAEEFGSRIEQLATRIERLPGSGAKVIATEPVAYYLLEAAGLEDVTPAEFAEAIEEERDVPIVARQQIGTVIAQRQVRAVVHNPQTTTPATAQVIEDAKSAGIAVVEMTETLPADEDDYVEWMSSQVDALEAALR